MSTSLVLDPPIVGLGAGADAEAAADRLPVRLLGLWLALVLLVPDRYTLPEGANIAVRPHHAALLMLLVVVARRFASGRRVGHLGPAAVVLLLPAAAAVSLLHNLGRLGSEETAAGVRAFGEVSSLALIVLLTAAVAPDRRQRRGLVALVVGLLTIGSFLGFWEASTGRRALVGLDRAVPVLGVETFSATGAKAAANPFADSDGFQRRLGMIRVAGAARHAIEFSVVMCFGVALACALVIGSRGLAWRGPAAAAAISTAVALPLALARSGVIGLVAVCMVVVVVARRRRRAAVLVAVAAGLFVFGALAVQPKATDALVEVFFSSRDDPSVEARAADYPEIDRAVGTEPWFGIGIGQWESYRTPFGRQLLFDNQYLLSAEETGLFGLFALIGTFAAAVATGLRWCRRAGPERPLAVGVLAALVAFVVVSATFDSLYFSQAASLFMFFFGLSCAAVAEERAG